MKSHYLFSRVGQLPVSRKLPISLVQGLADLTPLEQNRFWLFLITHIGFSQSLL